jgi:hypothetical protein
MQEVQQPLLVLSTLNMLLNIIGILTWGVGLIPQMDGPDLRKVTTLWRQFEQAELPM